MNRIRNFLLFTFLLIATAIGEQAQSGGGNNPYGGFCPNVGDVNDCHGNGLGNNPWPMKMVTDILKEAKDYYGMSLGQLVQVYHDCRCAVTYLGGQSFRVSVSGGGGGCCIIVVLENL